MSPWGPAWGAAWADAWSVDTPTPEPSPAYLTWGSVMRARGAQHQQAQMEAMQEAAFIAQQNNMIIATVAAVAGALH